MNHFQGAAIKIQCAAFIELEESLEGHGLGSVHLYGLFIESLGFFRIAEFTVGFSRYENGDVVGRLVCEICLKLNKEKRKPLEYPKPFEIPSSRQDPWLL